jgi:signal peptidase I
MCPLEVVEKPESGEPAETSAIKSAMAEPAALPPLVETQFLPVLPSANTLSSPAPRQLSAEPQAEVHAMLLAEAGVMPLAEAGAMRQAEWSAMPQAEAGVMPLAEAGTMRQAEAGAIHAEKPARRFWQWSKRRWLVLMAVVLGIRIFVGEASVVPTASMEGTILVGDHLFMDKLLYGPEIPVVNWRLPALKTVRRGEIVVFRYPRNPAETFLKRVAAVGGDRVEIRNGILYVNSKMVEEPYAVHHAPVHNPQESWGPTIVPPGQLFVMGDNRDNSSDSRDWGFVPGQNVIGEPLFVYWSYDAPSARWLDENPAHKVSFYASIAENFFSRTRWSRTGMLL